MASAAAGARRRGATDKDGSGDIEDGDDSHRRRFSKLCPVRTAGVLLFVLAGWAFFRGRPGDVLPGNFDGGDGSSGTTVKLPDVDTQAVASKKFGAAKEEVEEEDPDGEASDHDTAADAAAEEEPESEEEAAEAEPAQRQPGSEEEQVEEAEEAEPSAADADATAFGAAEEEEEAQEAEEAEPPATQLAAPAPPAPEKKEAERSASRRRPSSSKDPAPEASANVKDKAASSGRSGQGSSKDEGGKARQSKSGSTKGSASESAAKKKEANAGARAEKFASGSPEPSGSDSEESQSTLYTPLRAYQKKAHISDEDHSSSWTMRGIESWNYKNFVLLLQEFPLADSPRVKVLDVFYEYLHKPGTNAVELGCGEAQASLQVQVVFPQSTVWCVNSKKWANNCKSLDGAKQKALCGVGAAIGKNSSEALREAADRFGLAYPEDTPTPKVLYGDIRVERGGVRRHFQPQSMDLIFTQHTINKVLPQEVPPVLADCARVLARGGIGLLHILPLRTCNDVLVRSGLPVEPPVGPQSAMWDGARHVVKNDNIVVVDSIIASLYTDQSCLDVTLFCAFEHKCRVHTNGTTCHDVADLNLLVHKHPEEGECPGRSVRLRAHKDERTYTKDVMAVRPSQYNWRVFDTVRGWLRGL